MALDIPPGIVNSTKPRPDVIMNKVKSFFQSLTESELQHIKTKFKEVRNHLDIEIKNKK